MYFDYAATSLPKPAQVTAAVTDAMNRYGNPSRGAHDEALGALRCMLTAREIISEFFNVGSPMRVAFCSNATMALNIAISGIEGHIVTTAAEHNSVLRPVYRHGNYSIVPVDPLGRLDLDRLFDAVRPDTQTIVMTHASNVTGNGYDISSVGSFCRQKGILLIVDAAQSAGLLPVDLQKMNVDALCFSGHKSLYGPQGTGGLCLSERFSPAPLMVGGSGSHSFSETHPDRMPEALEAGTQNVHGIAGLAEGVKYVQQADGSFLEGSNQLAALFVRLLKDMPEITLYGDFENPMRTPVVSLNIAGMESGITARFLAEDHNISVRAGAHCAPLMHRAMGTEQGGAVRFSFSHYHTEQEINGAVQALKEIINAHKL